jgi:hypothetical protein
MHFQKDTAIKYFYEVETKDVILSLTDALKKSEDFTRRLFYRFDWMQVYIDATGRIISIENSVEMKESWKELKKEILSHYKGKGVLHYLEEVEDEFQQNKSVLLTLEQYLHFGLLFPCVPLKHNREWNRKRQVEFSEYEKERFEEQLVYTGVSNGLRSYYLTGNILPESKAVLSVYEGKIIVRENELLPMEAALQAAFTLGKIKIAWHFELNRKIN